MNFDNTNKYKILAYSLVFDGMGYVSFIFPLFDIVWAPAAGYLMTKLYKGKSGKIAGIIAFIEEALPLMDVIPTFTLMWLYTFVFQSKTIAKELEQ